MSEVVAHHPEPGGARRQDKSASGRRGRRHGIAIKPGTVKEARLAAGLSLGQVARNDISRTAIYFVETGKAKPSIETLKLIAERTGKPVDFFLAQPLAVSADFAVVLAELERLLSTGDNPAVLTAAADALARNPDPESAARIRFVLAMALLRSGQPVPGRHETVLARQYFEHAGDLLMVAECLGREAQAAYLLQDPGATSLAERALATCRSLRPMPEATEARLLHVLGGVYCANRDWERAIESYERAVDVGAVVHDLRTLAVMYGNLSLAYQATGRLGEALRYADRALTVYETLNDRLALARYENNISMLIFRQGSVTDAFRHANRSLAIFDELGVVIGRAHVLMTLAELEFSRGGYAQAERHARSAYAVAEASGERANVAEAQIWLARIAEETGDSALADRTFAAALALLGDQGPVERVTRAHVTYAEILESRGDLAAANAQLKLALRAAHDPVLARARVASA